MKKIKINKKKMLVGAGILAAGVAVFLIVRRTRKGSTAVNAVKEQQALQNGKTTVKTKSIDDAGGKMEFDASAVYPLKKGDTGAIITTLQHALNKVFNAGLSEDGIFGPKTEAACLQYLGSAQVTADKALALLVQYNAK